MARSKPPPIPPCDHEFGQAPNSTYSTCYRCRKPTFGYESIECRKCSRVLCKDCAVLDMIEEISGPGEKDGKA